MILGVAEMAQMDIDLELMRKDRSQCTQQELNQIRRERNRMHAKRTRVRKKVQMEEIQVRHSPHVVYRIRVGSMVEELMVEGSMFRVSFDKTDEMEG